MSISATARVTGHSRNTIARWLERASTAAKRFNHRMLRGFDLMELQADELCTFIGSKRNIIWLFATIEVSSRVWAGSVLGRRSDRNASAVINNVVRRGRVVGCPLIATDGFEYYLGAVARLFGSACVYGQVLKTRRNNRVVRVERRVKVGTANRLKAALLASEDSETLNTSFVERLNLTIRQASAYLRRRSPCHARDADQLCSHVELVRCHYNFVRPHRALRFGRETRTPAMQAALLRGSKTDPQRPLPTDPLTTDSVRRRPTKLSHLIEDVTCEDGLRLLPRPTARSKALPDDQLVPEEGVLHTGLLMVARVLLPLSPSSLLHLSDRAVARGRSWSPVQTRWLSWSVE